MRTYDIEPSIWDGDKTCSHNFLDTKFCSKCGAWFGTLGNEPDPCMFVNHLTQIFHEIKRVLRPDGCLWLNLGNSYISGKGRYSSNAQTITGKKDRNEPSFGERISLKNHHMFKEKDMFPAAWMVGLELIKDGWYLRNDVIWEKNTIPFSGNDRLTLNHEYILLMTKSEKYYFDKWIIAEPSKSENFLRSIRGNGENTKHANVPEGQNLKKPRASLMNDYIRKFGKDVLKEEYLGLANKRTVWKVNVGNINESSRDHYACYPRQLIRTPILATCPANICKVCGEPKTRIVKKDMYNIKPPLTLSNITTGWSDCKCGGEFEAGIVLDPFMGTGTTAVVAKDLGMRYIGIELSKKYAKIANQRIQENFRMDDLF